MSNIYLLIVFPGARSVNVVVGETAESPPNNTQDEGTIGILIAGSFPVSCSSGVQCFTKPGKGQPGSTSITTPIIIDANGNGKQHVFTLGDPQFGLVSNGESAIAELPIVEGFGRWASPTFFDAIYNVRDANAWNWSVPPVPDPTEGVVNFADQLPGNSFFEAQATEINGTDHQAQTQDDRDTFISGILLGVAGAAAIAAAQEGLHMLFDNDDDSRLPKPNGGN